MIFVINFQYHLWRSSLSILCPRIWVTFRSVPLPAKCVLSFENWTELKTFSIFPRKPFNKISYHHHHHQLNKKRSLRSELGWRSQHWRLYFHVWLLSSWVLRYLIPSNVCLFLLFFILSAILCSLLNFSYFLLIVVAFHFTFHLKVIITRIWGKCL